jgi:hypothetical protein
MSWSRNWPKNVAPAGWLGLFGLFALSERSPDDQRLRSGRQRILRVEQPAGLAQLAQRRLNATVRLGERRHVEHPPEAI